MTFNDWYAKNEDTIKAMARFSNHPIDLMEFAWDERGKTPIETKEDAKERITEIAKYVMGRIDKNAYLIIVDALFDHCFELMKEAGVERIIKLANEEIKAQQVKP